MRKTFNRRPKNEMEAREIIKEVGQRYADIQTYQDVGTLSITKGGKEREAAQLVFKTYFKRPCYFRFESNRNVKNPESRFVLWCDGQKVARQSENYTQQLSENFSFINTLKDLDRALSSMREAQPIACLLIAKLSGQRLTALSSAKRLDDEIYNGETCYHIQSNERGEFTDAWIAKSTLRVLKLIEKSIVASSEETLQVGSQNSFPNKVPLIYEYQFQNVWIDESIPAALFQIPIK